MIADGWLLGILAALVVAQVLFAYGVRRHARSASRSGGSVPADGAVECPSCGAENELGYRYCRSCVDELPGAVRYDGGGAAPMRWFTR